MNEDLKYNLKYSSYVLIIFCVIVGLAVWGIPWIEKDLNSINSSKDIIKNDSLPLCSEPIFVNGSWYCNIDNIVRN